ncbi:Phage tail assembly protein I [Pseudomonas sp. XWY-1]|uniref:tail assembly protein n=1 Tax=Pseudomonas TaxID=286 RepID=UPI000CDCD275|nr:MULTISPECIES: tail assembly protein [unclassified Pseudomonas]QNV64637.1 tail assembly protein [Pseudomonas sp. CFA]HEN8706209.1 tail assembly protein [Pseudomonas putida]AUZ57481.1 Phage tail assembly protein I [Pseudomonas sp. XWY-1]MCX2813565.1 tail assembly protein [Pseudomonas sp. DCB_E]MCX9144318.1 tail assembly protein [Pseudomonas sp. DCB_Q]
MAATVIDYAPKTKIRLGGFLGKKYGKHHHFLLQRGDAKEAAKALDANYPGFARDLADAESRGLRFAIFKNGKNIGDGDLTRGGARELWFVPVVHGSKRAGLLQTIVGIALLIAGPFTGGATYGPGIALVAGGVIQMLSPQAKGLSQSGAPENLPSYAFGSAKNTTASGLPVPICIGERRWGGAIISASIVAQDKA